MASARRAPITPRVLAAAALVCATLSLCGAQYEPIRPRVLLLYSEPGKHYRAEFDIPLKQLGWEADRVLVTDFAEQVRPVIDQYDIIVTATIWVSGGDIPALAPVLARWVNDGGTLILHDANHVAPLAAIYEQFGDGYALGRKPGFYWDAEARPPRPVGFVVPPPEWVADTGLMRAPMDIRPHLQFAAGPCWQSLGEVPAGWQPMVGYPDGHVLMAGREQGDGYLLAMSYYYSEKYARFQEAFLRNAWAQQRFSAQGLEFQGLDAEREGIRLRVCNLSGAPARVRFDLQVTRPDAEEPLTRSTEMAIAPGEVAVGSAPMDLSALGTYTIAAQAWRDGERFWTTEALEQEMRPPLSVRVTKKYHYQGPVESMLEVATPAGPIADEVQVSAVLRSPAGEAVDCQVLAGLEPGDRLLRAGALPAGEYSLRVSATDDGGATVSADAQIVVLGARRVMFDEHHRTIVDGQVIFPVGIYFPAPSRWEEVRRTGFNSMYWLLPIGWGCEAERVADTRDEEYRVLQRRAEEVGLLNLVHLKPDDYQTRVPELSASPSTLAWYIWDEPDLSTPGTDRMAEWYDELRALDPEHPVLLCSGGQAYAPYCDVYMTSGYPCGKHPLDLVADMADLARSLVHDQKPAWLALWAYGGYEGGPPLPTPAELRCITWLALAHGHRGVWYYAYYTGAVGGEKTLEDYPEVWASFEPLLTDLRKVEGFLLAPDGPPSLSVTATDPAQNSMLHALERQVEGRPTLLLVNDQEDPLAVTVTCGAMAGARDLLTGRTLAPADGRLTLTLEGLGAVVLEFDR